MTVWDRYFTLGLFCVFITLLVDGFSVHRIKRQSKKLHEYFMSYNEEMDWLKTLANSQNWITLETFGNTSENRDVVGIVFSKYKNKPVILFDSGVHAREWASISSMTYVIDQLATTTEGSALLEDFQFVIIPMLNPDGYEYSRTTNRAWRKNRQTYPSSPKCAGVDVNRNFGYYWGGEGASNKPCQDDYRGPDSNSEKETKALIGAMKKYKPVLYSSFHAYGRLLLTTYGFGKKEYAPKYDTMIKMATYAKDKLVEELNVNYTVGSSADTLYPAAGGSDDYANGALGIPYAFTIELAPYFPAVETDESVMKGFQLPSKDIKATGKEAFRIIQHLAYQICQYETPICAYAGP